MLGSPDRSVVVVGAGVSGLVLARELTRAGLAVTVIEKERTVGGLARSVTYGDFTFDIGPHRFHTDNPKVLDLIVSVLGDDRLDVPRRSAVWMFGGFHEWPLRPSSILSMPVSVSLRALLDLMRRNRKHGENSETFETYIRQMYGDTLYRHYFEPYTLKFTHRPASELDVLWAQMGIDRSVIDPRVKLNNLNDLVRNVLLPSPVNTRFIYPSTGGVGVFGERLAAEIESGGGKVISGVPVDSVQVLNGGIHSVTAGGEDYPAAHLVWTAPLPELVSLLGLGSPKLSYLSLMCVNVEAAHPSPQPYQWCYVSDSNAIISRASVSSLFNPALAPPGTHGVCAEVTFCPERGAPDAVEEKAVRDLVAMGLLNSESDAKAVHVLVVENAYPVYEIGFREVKKASLSAVGNVRGLSVLGRTGSFWYNNMDHSIAAALELAGHLLSGLPEKQPA